MRTPRPCSQAAAVALLCLAACGDTTRQADASTPDAGRDAQSVRPDARVAPDADAADAARDATPEPDGTAEVDAGAKDSGPSAPLDETPPALVQATPGDGASGVRVDDRIELIFTEAVHLSDGAITAVDERSGTSLTLARTSEQDSARVTLVLQAPVPLPAEVLLTLTSDIVDLAGNPLQDTIELRFAAPVWLPLVDAALNHDAGTDVDDVRVAADAQGRTVVAFVEGGNAFASRLDEGQIEPLGPTAINAGPVLASQRDESSLALVIGDDGEPVVAFREATGLVVRRFDGSNWVDVGVDIDPEGGGDYAPALALDTDGNPVVAFDVLGTATGLRLRRFANDSWQTLEALDVQTEGVRLAGGASLLAAAFHDATAGELSVLHFADTTSGPTTSPGVFEAPPGSFDVTVGASDMVAVTAQTRGTATLTASAQSTVSQDLGFHVSDRATDRALALAPSGELYGLFSERPAGSAISRVFLQRLDGNRFEPLGPALNRDLDADGTGSTLAIDATGAPVAAWIERAPGGTARLFVNRYNGVPSEAPAALVDRREADGCLAQVPGDGSPLEATGCFSDEPARTPIAGFVPYDVRSPLWTDGAFKRRFFMLPEDTSISYRDPGIWTLPEGAILIKEFSIEGKRGDPSTLRPVETRFLVVRNDGNWDRYSYEWNQAATQATLREADPAVDKTLFDIMDESDQPTTQAHFYPNRSFCLQCHEAPGKVLGLQTVQINRNFDYGDTVDNQLRALQRAGLFDAGASSGVETNARFMPNAMDATYPLEQRLRAYLHANCSSCHHPLFGMDLRHEVDTLDSGLCTKITKGDLDGSIIYWRDVLRQAGPGQAGPMPPLGTLVLDTQVEMLLTDWILDPLNPCP